jgi:Cu-processing system permease protein
MNVFIIALRELKLGFRNPWAYSFMALFAIFSLSLLTIHSQSALSGFTSATGAMLNLILYLLPLMTMLLGSFAVTAEREEGGWALLSTYSIGSAAFIGGKYIGLAAVLLIIVSFGYGFSGLLGIVFGEGFSLSSFLMFFTFSTWLVLLFLGLAMIVGALSRNRWQALTFGVAIWFVYILAWPTLLVSLLEVIPYVWTKPTLISLTFFNPAELVRIFMVTQMGGGSIFGPEYYRWIDWMNKTSAPIVFFGLCLAWIGAATGAAMWIWERGRYRE